MQKIKIKYIKSLSLVITIGLSLLGTWNYIHASNNSLSSSKSAPKETAYSEFRPGTFASFDVDDTLGKPKDTLGKKKDKPTKSKFIRKKKAAYSPFYSYKYKRKYIVWNLISISGEVMGKGLYREQQRLTNDIYDTIRETYFAGGLKLNTSSYFLTPKFLVLDIDGEYNPESYRDSSVVVPDRTESNELKKLGISANFFRNRKVNLVAFTNYADGYQTRENLTSIRSKSNQWGANLNISSKALPLTVNFSNRKWDQTETVTGREFKLDEIIFRTGIDKSFTDYDKNKIEYTHTDYKYVNENDFETHNRIDEINLNNKVYFDAGKKHYFNSIMSDYNHDGSKFNFNRFQAFETLSLKLNENLNFINNYNFFNTEFDNSSINQHNILSSLDHTLFKSLNTKIFGEYNNITQTYFLEKKYKAGIEFQYNNKFPFGRVNLLYRYNRYHQQMESDPTVLIVHDEEVYLDDSQITLLSRPYIDLNSIYVKDVTNTITYQVGLDFVLIQHNNFIEIKRLPGGLIPDKTTVYVDYSANQPGTYSFNSNGHYFSATFSFLKDKLDVYYKMSNLDYTDLNFTDFLSLNYLTQNVVGSKMDFGFLNFGVEYDNYNSTIIPYTMMHYFINAQKNFNEKVLFAISGNKQNYHLIDENVDQQFADLTGTIAYSITPMTKLNFDLTYRQQKGAGIDLDMYTAKTEISTRFRQLYFDLGAQLYKRDYVGEEIKFRGIYFQISRKF